MRLIALQKGNNDVRPIVVGNVFRRIVAKAACNVLRSAFEDFFSPFQFGVATPGGSEQFVHLLQTVASQTDWVVMKTDAKNAFNSVSRQRFLDLVGELFP